MNLPISTRRLLLRPFREADLGEFVAYRAVTDARNRAMALLERLGFRIHATAEAMFKGAVCQEHTYTLSRVARKAD